MAASIKPSEERKDEPHYRNMHMCLGQAAQPDFSHKRIHIQKQGCKTVVALQSLSLGNYGRNICRIQNSILEQCDGLDRVPTQILSFPKIHLIFFFFLHI